MRRLGMVVVTSACACVTSACSFEHGAVPTGRDGGDDAPAIDVPMIDGGMGWSTPVEIAELTSFSEDDPSLTSDLLEIYFGSRRTTGGQGNEDIWMATRASVTDPWGTPIDVGPLDTADTETTGKVTADGLYMYFTRVVNNDPDVYFASRVARDQPWLAPVRVNELSTNDGDYGPASRPDRLRIVMCRGPRVADEALWVTERSSTGLLWPAATVIGELDEAGFSECDPMEPTDNVLYFASNHTADGRYDIYRTERASGTSPYATPVPVGEVNTANFDDRDPWVSADEHYMVFSSDRSGGIFKLFLSTR